MALLMIAALATMHPGLLAQSETSLSFEVASIKQSTSGQTDMNFNIMPNGRLVATNVPVQLLLRIAHAVQPYQLVNAPDWVESDRYDILATAPQGVAMSFQTLPGMLRQMLADRLELNVRKDVRPMPIYKLVRARTDGRLGTEIAKSSVDCAALLGRQGGAAAAPSPPSPPSRFGLMPCTMSTGVGRISMSGLQMSNLVRELSGRAGRVVIDDTGLDGQWDLELQYTPDLAPNASADDTNAAAAVPNAQPSLFTALQQQLGLKLQADRGPVEVLVVEKISRPQEN
jgi:uncharacterized protein (TIGR03435 family)